MYFYIHDIIEHHLFVQIVYTSSDIRCNKISVNFNFIQYSK